MSAIKQLGIHSEQPYTPNAPIYITGANGHRRELGIYDASPRPEPPREIPMWEWQRVVVRVYEGWAPRRNVRATWELDSEPCAGQLMYVCMVHPEDLETWKYRAKHDPKVIGHKIEARQ
jgi:hypothetical protein